MEWERERERKKRKGGKQNKSERFRFVFCFVLSSLPRASIERRENAQKEERQNRRERERGERGFFGDVVVFDLFGLSPALLSRPVGLFSSKNSLNQARLLLSIKKGSKLTGIVPVADLGHRAERCSQEGQREEGGAEDGVHGC